MQPKLSTVKNVLQIIREVYSRKMIEAQQFLTGYSLNLHGDGRFDSPGHTALHGCYTLMDAETSLIVACQVMKVKFYNTHWFVILGF